MIDESVDDLIKSALREDFGNEGDITSLATISQEQQACAYFLAKEDFVCAGLDVAKRVFQMVDSQLEFKNFVQDSCFCKKGEKIAQVTGSARSILSAERTTLNFLQKLSGIASLTRKYVEALEDSSIKILDTRKTTPSWRKLEKYAVKMGGGTNHRYGLYDKIMIKDNHLMLSGNDERADIGAMVEQCREKFPNVEVEVEADTLEQVKQAVEAKADCILLDNMTNQQIAEAVKINNKVCQLEVSGRVKLERLSSLKNLDIDYISIGALTHSSSWVDISLDIAKL